jgi:hypothetical protein
MISIRKTPTLLAVTIGLLIACAGAGAQTTKTDAEQARELEKARAELNRAAQRYAELSRANMKFDRAHFEREFEQRFTRQPVLGVVLSPDPKAGVRIAAVTPDSAAAKAGLRSGDVLTAIDNRKLDQKDAGERLTQARKQLGTLDVKSSVTLAYTREGRAATARATPQLGDRLLVARDADGNPLARPMPFVAPQVRSELIRLDCDEDDEDCRLPALSEAFRWNGLNLATVDAQLGRYFGAQRGVLVLSTGPELSGLQAGDVIQRIDDKPVNSPREAMAALRGKAADSRVGVTYLRDRKVATTQVTVPKTAMLRIPRPPMPPVPPVAPRPPAPPAALPKPPALPAVPAPPAAPKPPQAMTPPTPPAAPDPLEPVAVVWPL